MTNNEQRLLMAALSSSGQRVNRGKISLYQDSVSVKNPENCKAILTLSQLSKSNYFHNLLIIITTVKTRHGLCFSLHEAVLYREVAEMGILAKLLLLIYLLVMVLLTILSVTWILTVIFKPEWTTKKTLLMKFQKIKSHDLNISNKFRE